MSVVDAPGGYDHVERLSQLITCDDPAVESDLGEDRLGHQLAQARSGLPVKLLRLVEQIERQREDLPTRLQLSVQPGDLLAYTLSLVADRDQLLADPVFGQLPVGCQIEQVVLPGIECREPGRELLTNRLGAPQIVDQGFVQSAAHGRLELCPKLHRGEVIEDRLFDPVDIEVGRVAQPFLSPPAEEVVVLAAVALRPLDDEPMVATSTPQHPLEVVVVRPRTGASSLVRVEHLLDPLEQLWAYQCFMPPRVLDTFVGDVSQVVPVP